MYDTDTCVSVIMSEHDGGEMSAASSIIIRGEWKGYLARSGRETSQSYYRLPPVPRTLLFHD